MVLYRLCSCNTEFVHHINPYTQQLSGLAAFFLYHDARENAFVLDWRRRRGYREEHRCVPSPSPLHTSHQQMENGRFFP